MRTLWREAETSGLLPRLSPAVWDAGWEGGLVRVAYIGLTGQTGGPDA